MVIEGDCCPSLAKTQPGEPTLHHRRVKPVRSSGVEADLVSALGALDRSNAILYTYLLYIQHRNPNLWRITDIGCSLVSQIPDYAYDAMQKN